MFYNRLNSKDKLDEISVSRNGKKSSAIVLVFVTIVRGYMFKQTRLISIDLFPRKVKGENNAKKQ